MHIQELSSQEIHAQSAKIGREDQVAEVVLYTGEGEIRIVGLPRELRAIARGMLNGLRRLKPQPEKRNG